MLPQCCHYPGDPAPVFPYQGVKQSGWGVGGRANTPNLFLIFVFVILLPGCLFVFVFPPIKVALHCILPDIVVALLNCTNISVLIYLFSPNEEQQRCRCLTISRTNLTMIQVLGGGGKSKQLLGVTRKEATGTSWDY